MEAQQYSLYDRYRQLQKQYTKEEIEKHQGHFDQDGFYILEDNSYFDAEGYFFDKDGYDDIGGYYDSATGVYVPPPEEYLGDESDDMEDYYDELCGIEDEDEEEEQVAEEEINYDNDFDMDDEEVDQAIKMEHCLPALRFLEQQPKDKKHIVKIENVPRRATDANLLKFLQKKISGFTH
jgi:hypothetical protein